MATAPLKRSINDTSSEPTDEVNPYASPGDAGTAKPQVSGALELAKMWLKSIANSSETLLSSRQQIIDRVNEQSRAMGGESLMSGKEKHVVSQTRRKAAWFLICSVLLPAIGATFVVSQLDGSWWITLLIGLLALVGFLLGGGILYLTTVYAGPRWLRRWFRGNPPPIRPQHDEDSAFFGIRMPVPPQAGESARPILRFEYRMNAAADLEVCLVDTVNATQFERPITCRTPGQWTRIEVNFDLLLKEAGSSFCGDEVRLIPPQDAELEIDDLVVFYPLQTNDVDAGTTV